MASGDRCVVPMMLEARDLRQSFRMPGGGRLQAVGGVSLSIAAGETVALVGESGSGKTTIGRMIAGLGRPDSGRITLHGAEVTGPGRAIQMVFQDSAAALNPRRPVGDAVMAPLRWHLRLSAREAEAEARAVLVRVGLDEGLFGRLPHTLSGGQRQRVGIARALAARPEVLIADEPVSALDVSVRAHVLRLFAGLEVATLFVTHDLGVVRAIARRVVVLYRGQVVEEGSVADVMDAPLHPYAQALRAAVPVPDPTRARVAPPRPPEVAELPGCPFRARCPAAVGACGVAPGLRAVRAGHWVACHLA